MRQEDHCKRMIELYKQAYKEHNMKQSVIDKAFKERYNQEYEWILEEKVDSFISKHKREPYKKELKEIESKINKDEIELTTEEQLEVYESLWDYDEYRPVDTVDLIKYTHR